MILYDLRCLYDGETFEVWFRSSADYGSQLDQGLIQCPFCQSSRVEKAPMAPNVPRKQAVSELAILQSKLLENSEWVGDSFSEKARAMHNGEVEPRLVHGRATLKEARELAGEGVPVVPLPLPVVPPGQVN